jgi:predicted ATPase
LVEVLRDMDAQPVDDQNDAVLEAALPVPAVPFIGRVTELAQIAELLAQPACRWLTLAGPGGVGKTRLALEAARLEREKFADGVIFVSLAGLEDAALIPTTIAQHLPVTLTGPPEKQLAACLRPRTMLLVLDNVEQLGSGLGWMSDLLAQAPNVKLLVTSREQLQLAEEWMYWVPALADVQAMELFGQTARRARPGLDLAEQMADVTAIIQLVENLPLAIELAAGWAPFMSCAQIAEHIRHDLDFLTADTRNIPESHRSLRAVFDHSWRLLSAAEQAVLMRLSVFRGGWSAEEAELVAGATLPRLRLLVEKSLVRIAGDGRYDLHSLTRQYAADALRAAGEDRQARQQHLLAYLALAERLDLQHPGQEASARYARLDREPDNFRAALAWALESELIETGLRLANTLMGFWITRSYLEESRWWFERLLAEASEDLPLALHVNALTHATFLAARLSDTSAALTHAQQAVRLCEAAGEAGKPALAHALAGLVMAHSSSARLADDFLTVFQLNERAIPLYRELGEVQLLNMSLRVGGGAALALRD